MFNDWVGLGSGRTLQKPVPGPAPRPGQVPGFMFSRGPGPTQCPGPGPLPVGQPDPDPGLADLSQALVPRKVTPAICLSPELMDLLLACTPKPGQDHDINE